MTTPIRIYLDPWHGAIRAHGMPHAAGETTVQANPPDKKKRRALARRRSETSFSDWRLHY